MTEHSIFDHVAIAIERWSDGYDTFVRRFGGVWALGADAGAFSPAQFHFHDEMKVELLAPGSDADNFVSRFLQRSGPGPHHLTFHVPDLDEFVHGCDLLGWPVMAGIVEAPGMREAFLHPTTTGWGTLIQAIESDQHFTSSAPDEVPEPGELHELCWVAVRVPDLAVAEAALAGLLNGRIRSSGATSAGSKWFIVEWSTARRLLVIDTDDPTTTGVDHIMFGPIGGHLPDPEEALALDRPPCDPAIGLSLLEVSHENN